MARTLATIEGSHGTIHFNPVTGQVMDITNNDGDTVDYYGESEADRLKTPSLFDLIEWHKFYPAETISTDQCYDILDFGYTTEDGSYEPPCDDWREEMARAAADENYLPFSDKCPQVA